MTPAREEDENKKDEEQGEGATAEKGPEYVSDGNVLGANDRVEGEESLAPPPAPFVQYGGPTEERGDGYKRPGSFRMQFGCRTALFQPITAMPFSRRWLGQ